MSAGNIAVDSNITGLAFAEEVLGTPKTLPGTPVWYAIEPNSYANFGATSKSVKRETINASRQNRKGIVTGIDVPVGFQLDMSSKSPYVMMQGFMFADWRAKDNLVPTAVSATQYTVPAGGAGFLANDLLFAEGFGVPGNNGLKVATASTGTTVSAPGLAVEASPPSTALITRVGRQGAAGDYTLTINGSGQACLNTTAGNFSTLGIIPGEWLFIGGDTAGTQFATAGANGFYRVFSVVNLQVVFDRWPGSSPSTGVYTAVADAGAAKTIQVFLGHCIKNEATPALQKFRTYQFERFLGGTKYQYELGGGANTWKLTVKDGDKTTLDLGFIGMDEDLTQVAAKAGTRVAIPGETIFNAATSFSRIRLLGQDGVTPLTAILTDLSLSIDNGINALTGITNAIGAVDLSAGSFTVSGSLTAYLSTLAAVAAVKTNPDCSVDVAMVENYNGSGTGWLFDVPLLMISGGQSKVEKDKPVTIDVNLDAAAHATLNHTLVAVRYAYLPQLAL
jgi:hypothetical protein